MKIARPHKFLTQKYEVARRFWVIIWRLKLITDKKWTTRPFSDYHYADKITQTHTFGKYDPRLPERGAHEFDGDGTCIVPAWFSEFTYVDEH